MKNLDAHNDFDLAVQAMNFRMVFFNLDEERLYPIKDIFEQMIEHLLFNNIVVSESLAFAVADDTISLLRHLFEGKCIYDIKGYDYITAYLNIEYSVYSELVKRKRQGSFDLKALYIAGFFGGIK